MGHSFFIPWTGFVGEHQAKWNLPTWVAHPAAAAALFDSWKLHFQPPVLATFWSSCVSFCRLWKLVLGKSVQRLRNGKGNPEQPCKTHVGPQLVIVATDVSQPLSPPPQGPQVASLPHSLFQPDVCTESRYRQMSASFKQCLNTCLLTLQTSHHCNAVLVPSTSKRPSEASSLCGVAEAALFSLPLTELASNH